MNHIQTPNAQFQFTTQEGVVVFSKENVPDGVYLSSHHACTFGDDDMVKDIYPITPVKPFTAETLPKSGELAEHLTMQDISTLIDVFGINEIQAYNADTKEIQHPNNLDIDNDRISLMVDYDKIQDVSELNLNLKKYASLIEVRSRYHYDDSRSGQADGCLNDWADFRPTYEDPIYTFTGYSVQGDVLTLTYTEKNKI